MNYPEDSNVSSQPGSLEYEDEEHDPEILEHSGDSDAEESRLDPQFTAKRRKAKQNESQKNKNANKLAKKLHNAATASKLPHSSTAESRSVVDFVKYMMGCSSRNIERPSPPSMEEIQAWESWSETNQAMIEQHLAAYVERKQPQNEGERSFLINQELRKIKKYDLNTAYQPSRTVSNSTIPPAIKNACDHEFKSKGFPRITFEWSNPSLANSQWNGATASILASHWTCWTSNERSLFKPSDVNVTGVIERWLRTSKKELQKKASQNNSQPRATQPTSSANVMKTNHKQARKKVADYRFQTACKVFPQHPEVWSYFQHIDTVSDYEENADISVPPKRIIPTWRNPVLSDLAHELDVATVQLAPRKMKTAIRARLAREGPREATQDEADMEQIPENLPQQAYSDAFLAQTPELELHQMGIKDQPTSYPLHLAVRDLQKKTRPTNSMIL
ncbi:hypothetical protein PTTG_12270 [Puccinia triticina 1-1 BBBD Race 1]|uniref:Uncharacterized protein n=1 Tax=Puccinia triticina (isolate 1-1 / race 1 (BBBD)) TaxID=630390 RepID=A0A180G5U7_PUCT1|nr:hypothetical protein PTTG_12270 [Puccinia triticina 1-1 BBBD Race 1]